MLRLDKKISQKMSTTSCFGGLTHNQNLAAAFVVCYEVWPSTTKWGSLRGVSKLRKVLHCSKHYFLHILMQKWILYDFPIKSYGTLSIVIISFKITSQRFGLLKIVICVYFYGHSLAPSAHVIFYRAAHCASYNRSKFKFGFELKTPKRIGLGS